MIFMLESTIHHKLTFFNFFLLQWAWSKDECLFLTCCNRICSTSSAPKWVKQLRKTHISCPYGRKIFTTTTMAKRRKWSSAAYILFAFGLFIALCTFYLALAPVQEPCNCDWFKLALKDIHSTNQHSDTSQTRSTNQTRGQVGDNQRLLHKYDEPAWGQDRLAIIVPFRDRMEELLDFVPFMKRFLTLQKVRYKIFVINQMDLLR